MRTLQLRIDRGFKGGNVLVAPVKSSLLGRFDLQGAAVAQQFFKGVGSEELREHRACGGAGAHEGSPTGEGFEHTDTREGANRFTNRGPADSEHFRQLWFDGDPRANLPFAGRTRAA